MYKVKSDISPTSLCHVGFNSTSQCRIKYELTFDHRIYKFTDVKPV